MKKTIKKIIPEFALNWYHFLLALMGAVWYWFPSRKIKVIGITGTSGKSTTVELTANILEKAGFKVASLSSIRFKIGEEKRENKLKMTMPGRLKIQKFLKRAVKNNCDYAVLEVTSEGIKQHRQKFIDFDVAVLTNLSPEHVESHGSFEAYRKAKFKLFQQTGKIHILNLDDKNTDFFLSASAGKKIGFIIENSKNSRAAESAKYDGIVRAENVKVSSSSFSFSVENSDFNLNLLGKFNVYNALAAISVGLSQGVDLVDCKKALEKTPGIPGRMEIIIKKPFTVIVDYAHTPVALEKVYKLSSRLKAEKSKLIGVLGACGGSRDKWKRPVLGKIASQFCDKVIITNEDPYDENPLKIIEDIEDGFSQAPNHKSQIAKYKRIPDRREAIKKALKEAAKGDVVVITGKGSEPWMCIENGKKIPWDDRKIVKEEFDKFKDSFDNTERK